MTLDTHAVMTTLGRQARVASRLMAKAKTAQKNAALHHLQRLLKEKADAIFEANGRDVARAQANGLSDAYVDRLRITDKVLTQMISGVAQIEELPDPIGVISDVRPQRSGIEVGHMRVPLGVIGMIYESRPNVTIDAAALAIKSGNALILRGGSEALESNKCLGQCVAQALEAAQLPGHGVQLIDNPDRALVGELITAKEFVDVLIPRGGKSLIARLMAEATVPMIKHLDGICHTYVDASADLDMAVAVADNAKTQRYSPCNATETLLVHATQLEAFLPRIGQIYADKAVEMRADERAYDVLQRAQLPVVAAQAQDWDTEYNAPIISIKVVDSLDEAIDFINTHGSHHTDAILTQDLVASERFLREVDSSSVIVNGSTRFADGFEYGLGAEIGISTDKIHVRGPVGLEGLTNQKFIVFGHGLGRK